MATHASIDRARSPLRSVVEVSLPRWAPEAWISIAVTAVFAGITLWWLTQDRSIPVFDAGVRLSQAIIVYEHLRAGSLGEAFTITTPYPPFSFFIGAVGLWIGGLGVAPPVIAQNIFFVSLLALGCHQLARMAYGPRAGPPAVAFALGSPLIAAQFHVAMIDAPETAMVAVAIWLIVASERFSRVWVSATAGLAVGLGLLTKEPFVLFVAGVVLVTIVRGGWRAWRGVAAFAAVALVIALPWYVSQYAEVHQLAQGATNSSASYGGGIAPPAMSLANLTWYFWSVLDSQLYAPLFAFAAAGWVWTLSGLVRGRPVSPFAWELTVGVSIAWVGITETFVHDTRYGMPLLPYLAVFGGGGIASLRARRWRLLATGALAVVVVLNTLGSSFGVGGTLSFRLPGAKPDLLDTPGVVTVASNKGFLVSGPHRDGDVLGLMRALQRGGVREVEWENLGSKEPAPGFTPDFSEAGLTSFTLITKLKRAGEEGTEGARGTIPASGYATLGHGPVGRGEAPPCVTLSDGTGVWVRLGNPNASGAKDYCPFRHPPFYGG
jgi:hypothetical protein